MKSLKIYIVIFSLIASCNIFGQDGNKMGWFKDAKFGIFIHWGIYSVDGIDESWSFFNEYLSHDKYMEQLDGFTAAKYDPDGWAEIIAQSGARYAVITTKHHDGVALWDTKCNELDVVGKTPAARDLISPFVNALRKKNVKVGLYYSLLDWSHPDYPNFTRTKKRYENDSVRWNRFTSFNHCQLNELMTQFNPDLYWFDGDWEQNAEKWKAWEIKDMILDHNPKAIINSRMAGYGDYDTPEQGVPIHPPKNKYWELCLTMNDSWGFQPNDHNYKSVDLIIRILADCISMGGNLLLDIGPKPDGTIPEVQFDILKETGKWITKHDEAIFGTLPGLPYGYFKGNSTISADSTVLYLFTDSKPGVPVILKGLKNKINRIRIVGNGVKLKWDIIGKQYWSETPGIVQITLPESVLDQHLTVIAIQLDGPIELSR